MDVLKFVKKNFGNILAASLGEVQDSLHLQS